MKINVPKIAIFLQKERTIFKPQGPWLAKTAKPAEEQCQSLLKTILPVHIIFDLSDFQEFDTTGVWLLQRTILRLEKKGHHIATQNGNQTLAALSALLDFYRPSLLTLPRKRFSPLTLLATFGKKSLKRFYTAQEWLIFLGEVTIGIFKALTDPKRLHITSIVSHIEKFGVSAVPIVTLISIGLGLVLAYQGEDQLRRFGAEIYTINLVAVSIVREIGILITAILVAGRSGSAITAQIGIMKLNQEVDALNSLGLNPMEVLVVPRILALIFVMPCLAFVSDIAGLLGGGIIVMCSLDVSPQLYLCRIEEAITTGSFWVGMIKAPLFGATIGIVSCFEGLRVWGTAESIGICTTRAVVEGIFLVTIMDALLSIFFIRIGL